MTKNKEISPFPKREGGFFAGADINFDIIYVIIYEKN